MVYGSLGSTRAISGWGTGLNPGLESMPSAGANHGGRLGRRRNGRAAGAASACGRGAVECAAGEAQACGRGAVGCAARVARRELGGGGGGGEDF